MAKWCITPKIKKSVVELQYWRKGDNEIIYELGWRGGDFTIETEDDNPPNIDPNGEVDMMNCGYDCYDWSTFDGCWVLVNQIDIADENELQRIEEFLEEKSVYDLEDDGWVCEDTEIWILCELNIDKVEEKDTPIEWPVPNGNN